MTLTRHLACHSRPPGWLGGSDVDFRDEPKRLERFEPESKV